MACAPPAGDVELAFLTKLDGVTGWSVDGGELTLQSKDGEELLRFQAVVITGQRDAGDR